MTEILVETAHGYTKLELVFCEITGKAIGWATSRNWVMSPVTPAYISFEVVDELGNVLNEDVLLKIETF